MIAAGGVATAAESGTVQIQSAEDNDSDSTRLSYTFTANANGTASVTPRSEDQAGGDVTFELQSASSFTVRNGQRYTIEYRATARSGADERTYSFRPTVDVSGGGSYSESLSVDVNVLEPRFGSVDGKRTEIKFKGRSTESATVDVEIPNVGDGVMTGISASVDNSPSGIRVDLTSPGEIRAGSRESVNAQITASDSVSEGTYTIDVIVSDSTGSSESFGINVAIIKAPVLSASDRTIDLGDVLIGESTEESFTLREEGGDESVEDIDVDYTRRSGDGSLSLSPPNRISAGGSDDGSVSIQASDDAEQYEQLEWIATFRPADPDGVSANLRFDARVIYPAYYGAVGASNKIISFDEPQAERESFSETVRVAVENGGDLPMDIQDVDASVSGSGVRADIVSAPDTISAQSTQSVEVSVAAGATADEGDRRLDVSIDAAEPGQTTTSSTVTVDHETDIEAGQSDVTYGQVVATQRVTRSTDISERLGYQDVRRFNIEQVSGPDSGWLRVEERPSSLEAGDSAPFVTTLQFDTRAEFFTTYTWRYEITGSNVDTETITITATPRPIDFTATVESLQESDIPEESDRAVVATESAEAMEALADRLREGSDERSDTARGDITTVSAAGRSSVLIIEQITIAREQQAAGNYTAAQRSLTRAAAAYRTLETASTRIETTPVKTRIETAASAADESLATAIDEQRAYYQDRAQNNETAVLTTAQTQRQLARLAALTGNTDDANEFQQQSQTAFERYSTLVSEGNDNLQRARQAEANLSAVTLTSIGGQPIFWIGALDRVDARQQMITQAYAEATEKFDAAGATAQATTAREEQSAFDQRLSRGRLLSYGLAGAVGFGFLIIVSLELRAIYRYAQESEEAISGDFLIEPEASS
jgi:hypothetical protein